MTAPLLMLKLAPDRPLVAAWGAERGLVGRDGDLGYTLHALLTAAFGELAPKPFRLQERRSGGEATLYAYGSRPEAQLLEQARSFAEPDVFTALGLDRLRAKPMPERFTAGRRLGFEVRVRPVRRRDRAENAGGVRERDVFLIACDRAGEGAVVRRDAVYGAWLGERLAEAGARLTMPVRLDAFRRTRVARKDATRRLRWIEGPDAVLSGELEVTDPDRFAALLARGVGRHRAFGFGMLLLRPPGG
ncbi:type I-E CRISPR-associated protein Cas6/Cse3/CasE [Benzoatithermus flavus]|uniref:Type I-E CRISPR-associated protein Cas6/Cse3/CasE n=1 Tax=Benzoatithermus flavus TaxID=3108223 RepID=A0ABU8XN19_9PROT